MCVCARVCVRVCVFQVLGLVKSKFDAMDDGHFVLVLDPSLFTDDFTQKVNTTFALPLHSL